MHEAKNIHDIWVNYFEINDKFSNLMWFVPESLSPYDIKVIEKAENLIARDYFDEGNYEFSEKVNITFASYSGVYMPDDEALRLSLNYFKMLESNPELKDGLLKKLADVNNSWKKNKVKIGNIKDISLIEAYEVRRSWTELRKFNKKISILNWFLPESFLPYPKEAISEAIKKAKSLDKSQQETDSLLEPLNRYIEDSKALTLTYKIINKIESNPSIKKDIINKLNNRSNL